MSRPMDKADFAFAIVLMVFGTGVLVESLRLPRLEALNINPYTVPGLLPGILGALIIACGLALLVRSIARGGWRLARAATPAVDPAGSDGGAPIGRDRQLVPRLGLTLVLTLGYALGLFGRVPFGIATAVFVFCFIVGAEWVTGGRRPPWRAIALATALALAVGFGVEVLFEDVFFVRLPG